MEYTFFEKKVMMTVGEAHFRQHKHLLPLVHSTLRERYMSILHLGYNIPEAMERNSNTKMLSGNHFNANVKYFNKYCNI